MCVKMYMRVRVSVCYCECMCVCVTVSSTDEGAVEVISIVAWRDAAGADG